MHSNSYSKKKTAKKDATGKYLKKFKMKTDIILAGVGGQGILTIAAAIGYAALKEKLYIKQAEVHGMSQRGGAVQSHLRISDKPIYSDLIPVGKADIILSVEPLEALRYLPYLSSKGWLIANSDPYENIDNYPQVDSVLTEIEKIKHHVLVNATSVARDMRNPKSSNIVMLGLAARFIGISKASFISGIKELFSNKGVEIIEQNVNAFEYGWQQTKSLKTTEQL
jgi:indolepyruvate ferredoxin oxidoreductase beta subunit